MLHVLACDNWGGTEVQVTTQIIRSDAPDRSHAVAILDRPGVLRSGLRESGVPVVSLAGRGGRFGMLVRLTRLLRAHTFDVVECYGFKSGLLTRAASLLGGRPPVLVGVRGLHFTEAEDPDGPKTRLVLALERILGRWAVGYDANSHGARDFLVERGFPASKFTVIANGVDADAFERAAHGPRERVRLVNVARFVPRKRHEILIEALALLRDQGIEVACELIGYGPTEDAVRKRAAEAGVEGVEFCGRMSQPEINQRLAAADIFVLNSLWEGMPGSVLEAMSASLPVVATDVSGTNEVVRHGETGLLVPPDDPRALADAIAKLARSADLRRSMGAAGRARIERDFSFERVVSEKSALYARIAGAE